MSRYIDADRFKSNLEKAMEKIHLIGGIKGVGVEAVIKALDIQPIADVVEVRHGEWQIIDSDLGYVEMKCSLCEHEHLFYTNQGYPYCPNCGAKMDGERKENENNI